MERERDEDYTKYVDSAMEIVLERPTYMLSMLSLRRKKRVSRYYI